MEKQRKFKYFQEVLPDKSYQHKNNHDDTS